MIDVVMGCPICKKNVAARTHNPSFPFCSPRCKTIDLGQWMNEQYRIAGPAPASAEDEDGDSATQSEHKEGLS